MPSEQTESEERKWNNLCDSASTAGPWCPPGSPLGQLCFIISMKSSLSVTGPPITRSVSLQVLGRHRSGYWLCLVVNGPIVGSPIPTTERLFQNSLALLSQLYSPRVSGVMFRGLSPMSANTTSPHARPGPPPGAPITQVQSGKWGRQ